MKKRKRAVVFALIAALLYGISAPGAKMILEWINPAMLAALLYLGAGIGMSVVSLFQKEMKEKKFGSKDFPYLLGMVVLDIAAPILLMSGLASTTAGNTSLLNNFEIAATAMIALLIFGESLGRRMWFAILLIFSASVILSLNFSGVLSFSYGSILILIATICWGFENNFTRMLSHGNPVKIVILKGFGSGTGALLYAMLVKELSFAPIYILFALVLGFISFGLSIFFYIKAQRFLGAARTSLYYAAAPFIGVAASYIFLKEKPTWSFFIALAIMLAGTYLAVTEKQTEYHLHAHYHDRMIHSHLHSHDDGQHNHTHE